MRLPVLSCPVQATSIERPQCNSATLQRCRGATLRAQRAGALPLVQRSRCLLRDVTSQRGKKKPTPNQDGDPRPRAERGRNAWRVNRIRRQDSPVLFLPFRLGPRSAQNLEVGSGRAVKGQTCDGLVIEVGPYAGIYNVVNGRARCGITNSFLRILTSYYVTLYTERVAGWHLLLKHAPRPISLFLAPTDCRSVPVQPGHSRLWIPTIGGGPNTQASMRTARPTNMNLFLLFSAWPM